jgi:hypothetical protein
MMGLSPLNGEQMSKFGRDKGQRGERLAISVLQPVVTKVYEERGLEVPKLERNLMQTMKGGHDIVGLDWLALEIKFQETLHINAWWSQTLRQAGETRVPVLMYKQSRVKWRVMLVGSLMIGPNGVGGRVRAPVDITLEDFLCYFERRIIWELDLKNVEFV